MNCCFGPGSTVEVVFATSKLAGAPCSDTRAPRRALGDDTAQLRSTGEIKCERAGECGEKTLKELNVR